MSANTRAKGSGFTLVEVLIALFLMSIVSLGVYSVYNTFFRQTHIQDITAESEQNARFAISAMERELMNAGYASGTGDILTQATSNSIEFIYTDPETDSTISSTAGKRLKVRYALQTTGGVQYLVRQADNLTDGTIGSTEQVIPYAQGLTLTYYDMNGNQIADTSSQANRNTVRFMTVNLVTQTRENIQGTSSPKTFTVETHLRLRNIGVGNTALDTTPPAAPAGVQVRDPGLCGRLKVKFTENSEGDISGYKIYYGVATGNYTGVVNVPLTILSGSGYSCSRTGGSIECTISPSSPALAYTPSTDASGTVYYLAVKAYDNSLNHSIFSSEVSGNPSPSSAVFGSGSNDSAINPVKPAAVTGFTGANGASDGQVQLSWTAYNTTSNPDVTGFRIYRSTTPFSTYPIDPATQPNVTWIAGEPGSGKPEVAATATSYLDPGPGLVGCRTYYYAIAPVNCDATLIPDNGGDPNEKKYLQTNYAATCGDGASACTPGTGFSAVSGSDTAPAKSSAPSAPTVNARAGWRRVAFSLTQPADEDLSQTCVYVNENAAYPALQTDTASYPKVSGCYQINTGSTPSARFMPDSGGVFTSSELSPAASMSFWHDSMTVEAPASPSLAETGTYSYRAVSFDLCGNGSAISAAQATTVLCGEDPASGEKPPAVTGASASCCSSPVTISWTPVPSDTSLPSTPSNPYDLAGYRIFRSTSADFSSATLVSGAAPFWGTSFSDTGAAEGGTYYYRIVSTDCPYERTSPSDATIRANMLSGYLNSTLVGPVKPGRLDRDEKCPGTGSCTKDAHREVITGVSMNNSTGTGTGDSTPRSELRHNTVTVFLNNTSAGTMTIERATVSWVNSSAYLREIKVGGGRSGMGEFVTSIAQGVTTTVTDNPPYSSAASNVSLTGAAIPAGARYVPIRFKFFDSSSEETPDMRDDQILITFTVRNDTTSTTGCVSYLTVSQLSEGISVPYGPSVTAAQQDRPSSPTFSYPVPGATGLNTVPSGSDGSIKVGSGLSVTVTANIEGLTTDASTGAKVAVTSAKLYYRATAKTVTTAPDSGYTQVTMTNTGANLWSGTIPQNDGMRVWYYILATDADGNFDRDPEMGHGAYVYDQESFNVCSVTPDAPTALTVTPSGADTAVLSWTAPSTYTNGAAIDAGDTIKYKVYRGGTLVASDITSTTYSNAGLSSGVYSYTVKAINSCTSSERLSSASNTAAACVGTSGQATLDLSPSSIYRGDNFTVNIVDCLAINGAYSSSIETVNTTSGFTGMTIASTAPGSLSTTITETGAATGTFTKTVGTTSSVTDSTKLLVLSADTITVTYPYATPSSKTISVIVDPCTNTPKAPTGLTGSVSGQNMTLSWSAVTQNTDNSAITDLSKYKIYEKVCNSGKPNCTGSNIRKDWFLRTSTTSASATSITVSADQGNLNTYIYYFKITAADTCTAPNESGYSNTWNETN